MRNHWKVCGVAVCIGLMIGSGHAAAENSMYTVKRGDSLIKIAKTQLGSAARWKEIAEMNGIKKPYLIRPGRELKLMAGTSGNVMSSSNAIPAAAMSPNTYQAPHATMKEDEGPIATIHPTTYQVPPAPIKEEAGNNESIHATTYQAAPAVLKENDKPLDNVITGHTQTPAPRRAVQRGNNYN